MKQKAEDHCAAPEWLFSQLQKAFDPFWNESSATAVPLFWRKKDNYMPAPSVEALQQKTRMTLGVQKHWLYCFTKGSGSHWLHWHERDEMQMSAAVAAWRGRQRVTRGQHSQSVCKKTTTLQVKLSGSGSLMICCSFSCQWALCNRAIQGPRLWGWKKNIFCT